MTQPKTLGDLRAGDTFVIGIFSFLLLCCLFIRLGVHVIFSGLSVQVSLGLGFISYSS